MKLYMLTEIPGELAEAAALVWADDPEEARWLLKEKTGRIGRVLIEVQAERGVWGMFGVSAANAETVSPARVWEAWNAVPEDEESPVKRVARQLGMKPFDVAAVVYPFDEFGWWSDAHEPDLPESEVRS